MLPSKRKILCRPNGYTHDNSQRYYRSALCRPDNFTGRVIYQTDEAYCHGGMGKADGGGFSPLDMPLEAFEAAEFYLFDPYRC